MNEKEEQNVKDFRMKLEELLRQMSDDEVVDLYNIFAKNTGSVPIYYFWEKTKFGLKLNENGFYVNNSYFIITETGAPVAFGMLSDPSSPFNKDKLMDAICENPKAYGFENE